MAYSEQELGPALQRKQVSALWAAHASSFPATGKWRQAEFRHKPGMLLYHLQDGYHLALSKRLWDESFDIIVKQHFLSILGFYEGY